MKKIYTPKAVPTMISASTSTTLKIKDNYFKVEVHEERSVPQDADVDMDKEWDFLFDELNGICDGQVEDILKNFRVKKST